MRFVSSVAIVAAASSAQMMGCKKDKPENESNKNTKGKKTVKDQVRTTKDQEQEKELDKNQNTSNNVPAWRKDVQECDAKDNLRNHKFPMKDHVLTKDTSEEFKPNITFKKDANGNLTVLREGEQETIHEQMMSELKKVFADKNVFDDAEKGLRHKGGLSGLRKNQKVWKHAEAFLKANKFAGFLKSITGSDGAALKIDSFIAYHTYQTAFYQAGMECGVWLTKQVIYELKGIGEHPVYEIADSIAPFLTEEDKKNKASLHATVCKAFDSIGDQCVNTYDDTLKKQFGKTEPEFNVAFAANKDAFQLEAKELFRRLAYLRFTVSAMNDQKGFEKLMKDINSKL